MKHLLSIPIFLLSSLCVQAEHPSIYVTHNDRQSINEKINRYDWASNALDSIKAKIDPYVNRHINDPEWIVSRLSMYWKDGEHYTQCYLKNQNWDYGEGNAPVPTLRMPGMRTWNKYVNVPLEERIPYNETGDMWGLNISDPDAPKVLVPYKESGHMIRFNNGEILTLAENAAFVYWLTREEKYARFAADIFYKWLLGTYYMNPILDPEKSSGGVGGYEPGGILGYYDYEQIHDDLAIPAATTYDLIFDYLNEHPDKNLQLTGNDLKHVAGDVFKRFINIGMVRGGKTGNWNVNGWKIMLTPILALEDNDFYEDGKGSSYYLNYFTNETTPYHDALPDILSVYNPITGLWPESPGYAFSTISNLLELATLLRVKGIDIIKSNPIMQKAATAVFPWLDSKGNLIVFGDSRGGSADYNTFESLLNYYISTNDLNNAEFISSIISNGIKNGNYKRELSSWTQICTFQPLIESTTTFTPERASYSPFHRVITLKNNDLMAVVYGGRRGSHLTPNGLALQLYGNGYAIAPDASGYVSYWSEDNIYHQSPTGSNTIIPGYTDGDIKIIAMDPYLSDNQFTSSTSLSQDINLVDVVAGEKRRTVATVATDSISGYYVDIFRSDLQDNDYLFHNVGKSLSLTDSKGNKLKSIPCDSIPNPVYHPGYAFFKDIKSSVTSSDIIGHWDITSSLYMKMHMIGGKNRNYFVTDAPYTTLYPSLTPQGVSAAPLATPTILVRQSEMNGWAHPFVAVFEPVKNNNEVVKSIKQLVLTKDNVVLKVTLKDNRTDYIFSSCDTNNMVKVSKIAVKGTFGLVTTIKEKLQQIYLVNGTSLSAKDCKISADKPVSVTLYRNGDSWYYSSTGNASVLIGKKILILHKAIHEKL